ncbi:hypothetical protein MNB_SUP05-10-150 [hydrothermal vent metagenome]|uniref:Phophatidylinositol-4-phosphate 5-kinase n=1 Tax=hydrothermal vent metagenome TaxID=652676 RepID=A0A1W1DC64_9ZZZZ
MIIATIAASVINTGVVAGFFDDLVDDLQNGSLESLVSDVVSDVTDVVSDVASEIGKAQDNSDTKSNAGSDDVLDGLGGLFENSDETDDTDDYAEEEVFEDSINNEDNKIVVNYDQLSKKTSFFGPEDPKQYLDDKPFTGIVDHRWEKSGNRYRIHYKDGLKHGLETAWYKNDSLKHTFTRTNGMRLSSKEKQWYENGNKKYEAAKNLELGPTMEWHENGQLGIKNELDVKNKYLTKERWREDGTRLFKEGWIQSKDKNYGFQRERFVKLQKWDEEGIKTFDTSGYLVGYEENIDKVADLAYKWPDRHDKYDDFYLAQYDQKDDLGSFLTISSLPVGTDADSCYYQNVVSRDYGWEIKKNVVQTSHSKDGYVITSNDLLQNCVSPAYKACKEDKNDTNACDQLFYQGVYSSEDAALRTQRQNLLKLERRLILKKAEALKKKYAKTWNEDITGIKRPTIIRTRESNIPLVLEGKLQDKITDIGKYTHFSIGLGGVKKTVTKKQTIAMDISKKDSSKVVEKDLMFDKLYVVVNKKDVVNGYTNVPRAFYGDKPYTGFTITKYDNFAKAPKSPIVDRLFSNLYDGRGYEGHFVKEVVEYKDGYLYGDSYGFYPNGRPSMHKKYKNGTLFDTKTWDPFGYLVSEIIFKDGAAVEERLYDENFDQAFLEGHELYPDTELPLLTSEIDIFNKQWLNTLNEFYGERKLSINTVAPLLQLDYWDGLVKTYWPNGNLQTEEEYWAGSRHGEVRIFEPVEIDPETKKQKVRKIIYYKLGREQAHLNILGFDYRESLRRATLDYECGGGNFAECVLKGVKNRLQVKVETSLEDGDKKYTHTATWGRDNKKLAIELGIKRNLKNITTSVNTAQCVTHYSKLKPQVNKILVKISIDVANTENTDYIVSKCEEARKKYYSDQYIANADCKSVDKQSMMYGKGFNDSKYQTFGLEELKDHYIKDPVLACLVGTYAGSDYYQHMRIIDKGDKASGLSSNPFMQDNGSSCDSSKGDLCFGRVSKNPALINNKYLDLSNWEKLSKKKSALIEK